MATIYYIVKITNIFYYSHSYLFTIHEKVFLCRHYDFFSKLSSVDLIAHIYYTIVLHDLSFLLHAFSHYISHDILYHVVACIFIRFRVLVPQFINILRLDDRSRNVMAHDTYMYMVFYNILYTVFSLYSLFKIHSDNRWFKLELIMFHPSGVFRFLSWRGGWFYPVAPSLKLDALS